MRLSDAIALGRVLHQPWHVGDDGFRSGEACAMQLAGAAANGDMNNWMNPDWTWAGEGQAVLPCACVTGLGVGMEMQDREQLQRYPRLAIIHLFNHHVVTHQDWTLDQLIDWVRQNEPEEKCNESASSKEICSSTTKTLSALVNTSGVPIGITKQPTML